MKILSWGFLILILFVSGSLSYLGLLGGFVIPIALLPGLFFGLLFSVWMGVQFKIPFFKNRHHFVQGSVIAMFFAYMAGFLVLALKGVNFFNGGKISFGTAQLAALVSGFIGAILLASTVHRRVQKLSLIQFLLLGVVGSLSNLTFAYFLTHPDTYNIKWFNNPFIVWQVSVGILFGIFVYKNKQTSLEKELINTEQAAAVAK